MTQKSKVAAMAAFLVVTLAAARAAHAAPNPCSLLTASQVSSALGVTVADGKSAIPQDCQWSQSNGGVRAKSAFLEILGPMGKLTPVDRFNTAKAPLGKIVKTRQRSGGRRRVRGDAWRRAVRQEGQFRFSSPRLGLPAGRCQSEGKGAGPASPSQALNVPFAAEIARPPFAPAFRHRSDHRVAAREEHETSNWAVPARYSTNRILLLLGRRPRLLIARLSFCTLQVRARCIVGTQTGPRFPTHKPRSRLGGDVPTWRSRPDWQPSSFLRHRPTRAQNLPIDAFGS
jgi:hypothetical protein